MLRRSQQSTEKTTKNEQQFCSQPAVYLLITGRWYSVGSSEALWRSSMREFAHTQSGTSGKQKSDKQKIKIK